MKNSLFLLFLLIITTGRLGGQNADSVKVKNIFDNALQSEVSFQQLKGLCEEAPGRLAGLPAMDSAMQYMFRLMKAMPFDSVYIQP
ncbi:MAG TPA: hypothetical protein PLA88_00090, partial [Bacteroidales bacterium]|nr:hypothetical protein [Bacteroidales bacterium]